LIAAALAQPQSLVRQVESFDRFGRSEWWSLCRLNDEGILHKPWRPSRQFVVQEAWRLRCVLRVVVIVVTPRTKVASGQSAGAEIYFFTGTAHQMLLGIAPVSEQPVESTTIIRAHRSQ